MPATSPARSGPSRREPRHAAVRSMWSQWPGLLVPPLTFLAEVSATYALVPGACDAHRSDVLYGLLIVGLAATLLAGGHAWREYAALGGRLPGDEGSPEERKRFLALLGVMTSALFALALLAQAIAQLLLPPCLL